MDEVARRALGKAAASGVPVAFDGVAKRYGNQVVLDGLTFRVDAGERVVLIGPSGSGKTTVLRCMMGFESLDLGEIRIGDESIVPEGATRRDQRRARTKLKAARAQVGMVFQQFNLFPHLTVLENITLGPRRRGTDRDSAVALAHSLLDDVGLGQKADSYPRQLSGGQQQRVAIARALAHEPEVLLCDEATSALDPETTDAILELLLKINEEFGITMLLITHEMNVIQKVCDRVAVMEKGQIVESGPVLQIFTSPAHETTRRFVNSLFQIALPRSLSRRDDSGRLVTLFVPSSVGETFWTQISRRFDVLPRLLSGGILHLKGQTLGRWVVHFTGEEEEVNKALLFLQDQGVRIEGVMLHAERNRQIS